MELHGWDVRSKGKEVQGAAMAMISIALPRISSE